MTEGTVSRWLKQVGESVAADEPLLGVSTDKVATEILTDLRHLARDKGPRRRDSRGWSGAAIVGEAGAAAAPSP